MIWGGFTPLFLVHRPYTSWIYIGQVVNFHSSPYRPYRWNHQPKRRVGSLMTGTQGTLGFFHFTSQLLNGFLVLNKKLGVGEDGVVVVVVVHHVKRRNPNILQKIIKHLVMLVILTTLDWVPTKMGATVDWYTRISPVVFLF